MCFKTTSDGSIFTPSMLYGIFVYYEKDGYQDVNYKVKTECCGELKTFL